MSCGHPGCTCGEGHASEAEAHEAAVHDCARREGHGPEGCGCGEHDRQVPTSVEEPGGRRG